MKLADIGPDLDDEISGLFEVGLLGRIRIESEIAQCRGKDIIGGIQHVNAAILNFARFSGLNTTSQLSILASAPRIFCTALTL